MVPSRLENPMSAMQTEVFEAFRAIDVPEDKALRAAAALTAALVKTEDETKTAFGKRDGDFDAIRKDMAALKSDVTSVKIDLATVKGDVSLLKWMLGLAITLNLTVLAKLFSH